MPLTKSDLQQIGNAVDERLKKRLGPIELRFTPIEKDLKYLKKKINKMDKTLDAVARNYDEGDVALGKRVKRIETHLNLPS